MNTKSLITTRYVFLLGLLIAIIATALEVFRGRAENFQTFYYSTIAFWGNDADTIALWGGGNPYTEGYSKVFRSFLYSPVFSILFTPLTWLPFKLAAFVWNIMNYSLFFMAMMLLPDRLCTQFSKIKIFLYLLLLLEASIFPFQYNISIAYFFIYAYIFLEKDKPIWAVLLIMLSATTKVYGIFQIALLFCYKNTWRNVAFAIMFGAGFALLPAFHTGIDGLLPYYGEWIATLAKHNYHDFSPTSLICLQPFPEWTMSHRYLLQLSSLAILIILFFMHHNSWRDFRFRTQTLGLLMAWLCLFGDATEAHTYIIAFTGYMLWYYTQPKHTKTDKYLFWANWFLFGVIPQDVLCPRVICDFINDTLTLQIYIFFFTWARQIYLLHSLYNKDNLIVSRNKNFK